MKRLFTLLLFSIYLFTLFAQTNNRENVVEMLYYDRGVYIASEEERSKLNDLIEQMKADSTLKIHIIGYGDTVISSLSGNTYQWECVRDMLWGTTTSITPSLTQGVSIVRSTADNDYITGPIKVLGINGTEQILTIELTHSDGNSQKIVSDISTQLADANSDKSIAITLSGDINTTIKGSIENATIDNWTQEYCNPQTVN